MNVPPKTVALETVSTIQKCHWPSVLMPNARPARRAMIASHMYAFMENVCMILRVRRAGASRKSVSHACSGCDCLTRHCNRGKWTYNSIEAKAKCFLGEWVTCSLSSECKSSLCFYGQCVYDTKSSKEKCFKKDCDAWKSGYDFIRNLCHIGKCIFDTPSSTQKCYLAECGKCNADAQCIPHKCD